MSQPTLTDVAVSNFIDWYAPGSNTRAAYSLDLKIMVRWCGDVGIDPMVITRLQLEQFIRYLEHERENKPATIRRRMAVIRHFYRLAAEDGLIQMSPAEHVRARPRNHGDTDVHGVNRHEMAAMLRRSQQRGAGAYGLISVMGLMGLRLSEACGLQVESFQQFAEGHRLLTFIGKGKKEARLPIPVPVLRALDAAAEGRHAGALFLRRDQSPWNGTATRRLVKSLGRECNVANPITPHSLRRGFVMACLDAGVSIRDTQEAGRWADPRMVILYDRRRANLDRHAAYVVAAFVSGA